MNPISIHRPARRRSEVAQWWATAPRSERRAAARWWWASSTRTAGSWVEQWRDINANNGIVNIN